MPVKNSVKFCLAFLCVLATSVGVAVALPAGPAEASTTAITATLDECITMALDNNRRRPASRFAVAMAEAQHRQALSGYWPQVSAKGGYQLMDEHPNYIFPASNFSIPIPMMGNIDVDIPAQDIKLMDRESWRASLEATWLLYDGGMRKGYREQAAGQVDIMKQEARRTDLQIVDSVKRYYYGSVLAIQLHQVGKDTLARMEATLNLTKTMYQEGSGTVKKTDWLDNKVMVENLRAIVAELEKNELLTQAALANSMGLPWQDSVRPADGSMPFTSVNIPLNELVGGAYQFNPDWAQVEAAIRAAEGGVRTARSGYSPKLAVTGELFKWWNDYDGGMATDRNKQGWTAGIGIQIPLFSGFLTKNKVAETKARVAQIKEQKFLLQEGLGLQLKELFLSLNAAEKTYQASQNAMDAAVENRDLNTRAYQHGLVETEKVIRAQLMEALMSAQHYKAQYDHIALQSQMNLIVGTEWLNRLASR